MHVIYDAANVNNLMISFAMPLAPLAMCIWGFNRWRAEVKAGSSPATSSRVFALGALFMFVLFGGVLWGNVYRVEHDYATGNVSVVEGEIDRYQASGDGKFVSFAIRGIPFEVSCCSPSPVYRGTPTAGLSPEVLYNGMKVRLTYLKTGEIVRIAARNDQP